MCWKECYILCLSFYYFFTASEANRIHLQRNYYQQHFNFLVQNLIHHLVIIDELEFFIHLQFVYWCRKAFFCCRHVNWEVNSYLSEEWTTLLHCQSDKVLWKSWRMHYLWMSVTILLQTYTGSLWFLELYRFIKYQYSTISYIAVGIWDVLKYNLVHGGARFILLKISLNNVWSRTQDGETIIGCSIFTIFQ